MSDKKGCAVRVVLAGTDENGQTISNLEAEWFGFERAECNAMLMDITEAVAGICESYNKTIYGDDYRDKAKKSKK